MLRILILQTCGGKTEAPCLDYTQSKHESYCRKHGYDYMRWDGIKKSQSQSPAYNKIYLLQEILQTNKYDGVFYLDTDAIIIDKDMALDNLMKLNKAVTCMQKTPETKDLDLSAAFFNMNHPNMKVLLEDWQQVVDRDKSDQINDERILGDIMKKRSSYTFLYSCDYFYKDLNFIYRAKPDSNITDRLASLSAEYAKGQIKPTTTQNT